jgi:HAD superfamily hydrolase (TIGR01662 family)
MKLKGDRLKVAAIVFDQGNTLLMDPFEAVMRLQRDRFSHLCKTYGLLIDADHLISEWTLSNSRVNYPYAGHFYQEEPIVQNALRNLGASDEISAFLALDLLREYRVGLQKTIESDDRTKEVKNTLEQLKANGKRLGVFSNDRAVSLGFVMSVMQIQPCFEMAETSELIAMEKPDPRVFSHIVDRFGVRPDDLAYVGDDPIRDIEAAKACGLKTVLFRVNHEMYRQPWRDYRTNAELEADAVIERFSELLDVIG